MSRFRKMIILVLFIGYFFPVQVFSDTVALEVQADGNVSVNTKLNINSVLHLTPQSEPPPNPSPGDIYFTTTEELLIYAHGQWSAILSAVGVPGTKHLTGGSGTWAVPPGIYSVTVTMTGGGGHGGAGNYSCQDFRGELWCSGSRGGSGGRGGTRISNVVQVTPGQQISYSVGGQGGTSTFGNLSATGGGSGGNYNGATGSSGSPQQGNYPYGSSYGRGGAGGTNGFGSPGNGGAIFLQW